MVKGAALSPGAAFATSPAVSSASDQGEVTGYEHPVAGRRRPRTCAGLEAGAIESASWRGTLFAAPGNPGIAQVARCVQLDITDHTDVVNFCAIQHIGLVVIGPEAPLVAGLADSLRAAGIATFGPSRAAAQLEGSKGFTKDICARAGIPTGAYVRVSALADALAALDGFAIPVVIKADGLAAGKGVTVAETRAEAEGALREIFSGRSERPAPRP